MSKSESKGKRHILRTLLIVILVIVIIVKAGGYITYKIAGDKMLAKIIAGKPGNAAEYDASNFTSDPSGPLYGMKEIFLNVKRYCRTIGSSLLRQYLF